MIGFMKNRLNTLYVSMDVESDGPCPAINNLLSYGAVAFLNGEPYSKFERNIDLLPDCKPNPKTMREFWERDDKHKALYAQTRVNTVDPVDFVNDLIKWAKQLREETGFKVVFVAAPSTYDYKWLDYYMHRFYGDNPFGFASCIDIKSFLFGRLGRPFGEITKRNYVKAWFPKHQKHTHVAVEDALEQGHIFINALKQYDEIDANTRERTEAVVNAWVEAQALDTSVDVQELVNQLMGVRR